MRLANSPIWENRPGPGTFHEHDIAGLARPAQAAKPDSSEWQRLRDIYLPLIRHWLSGVPGLRDEADDLAQEVLVVVFRELPSFERRRDGAFRAWLRQITVNRIRAFGKTRKKQPLAGLGDQADQLIGTAGRLR